MINLIRNKMNNKLLIFTYLISFAFTQNYDLPVSQVTGGQVDSESENYSLSSNTSSLSAEFSSSDSFSVSQGIMGVTKGCLLYTSDAADEG